MNVRLIAEIAGTAVGISVVIGCIWHWRGLDKHKNWFFEGNHAFTLLETFFNEAAVLWFVFPLLDTLYHIRQVNETVPSLLEIVGIWISSWSAALFFFYFAVICKKQADKKP